MNRIVIVGASLAGLRTAEALRELGFEGQIAMIGDETELPYDRPPLSKQFLRGDWDTDRITLRSQDELSNRLKLELTTGTRALELRPDAHEVVLSDGRTLAYDRAVIATGARARTLPAAEVHQSAHVVRTKDDSAMLRTCLTTDARIVVVGAGFIGAEVAASAKALGCDVTIIEAAPVPLERQLGLAMGGACGALHARNGVSLRCGIGVSSFEPNAVLLADGTRLPADHVVVGVGARPNTEWLVSSGLVITDGIAVDEFCRAKLVDGTVLDDVVAVGDVARFPNRRYESTDGSGAPLSMRIEHWTNAADMALAAANTLLGHTVVYQPVPYFWSDQYSHKIQFFGRADGFDEVRVVDGDPDDAAWVALYRRGDRLVAALGVSKIRALVPFRQMLLDNASWATAIELTSTR